MRKLILGFLITLLFSAQSWGAWLFDGTNDYVTLADNTALTLPDNNWTIAGWVKVNDLSGTGAQYLFDNWSGGNPFFNLVLIETEDVTNSGEINLDTRDTDGSTRHDLFSSTSPFTGNTNWTNIIVQRSGTSLTVYVNNTSVISTTVGSYDAVDGGTLVVGAGNNGGGVADGAWFDGSMADWAKWDRALNSAEIAGLVAGFSPNCYPGFQWFTPMIRDYVELAKGITVTNTGTVYVAHPRIINCGS